MFRTRYFCVCGPKLLVSGEPVLFQKKLLWVYGQGPFVSVTRVFVSVYGLGPFGSGGLFFVWDEFLLVRFQEPVFFSLERNVIVFAV